ncbi:SRPBCC family protein [Nocardioides ochotonae]|uniref:SRPBCC family protein n=1 Tax=Nocardioides ochotonae TaxID=2685869 RepID=UPI00140B1074|nr:SRPBCC family protein [Nocardioides ochotonae]
MTSRRVLASTTTTAPADVVFDILADPRQHSRVDGSGTVRDAIAGPDRLSLGAKFGMNMRMGVPYKITSTVVEFEEGRRLAWQHPGGHIWRYELEPDGERTRITETFDYSDVNGVQAKMYELLGMTTRNRRGIEKTLVRLADAAEQDARRAS